MSEHNRPADGQPNTMRWVETEEERGLIEDMLAWLQRKGLFVTTDEGREALIAEYFDIDLEALAGERHRALLRQAEIAAQHGYETAEEMRAALQQTLDQAPARGKKKTRSLE